jgi:pimeloyl-ACP methyl ester carboxylesterase
MEIKNLRKYGEKPFSVAVIHGGPGAPGEVAPVARELSSIRGILEPLQTAGTLEGQVLELKAVLEKDGTLPVILVGHSWGAMLGFILAARYPSLVKKLVLVGSGPFEAKYAVNILGTRLSRLDEEDRVEVLSLIEVLENPAVEDKSVPMARFGALCARADAYDPLPHEDEALEFQYDINKNVWQEAERLRSSGELLEMGKQVLCPVLALHGDCDSHPPEGVKEPLSRILKNFRFVLLEKCGHTPWLERHARDSFYEVLKNEIR